MTTASGLLASSASATSAGQRADRRRAEDDLGALERLGDRLADAVERPDLDAAARVRRLGVVADDLRAEAPLRGEPDRPADQPDAQDRYAHRVPIATRRPSVACRPPRRPA